MLLLEHDAHRAGRPGRVASEARVGDVHRRGDPRGEREAGARRVPAVGRSGSAQARPGRSAPARGDRVGAPVAAVRAQRLLRVASRSHGPTRRSSRPAATRSTGASTAEVAGPTRGSRPPARAETPTEFGAEPGRCVVPRWAALLLANHDLRRRVRVPRRTVP